MLIESCVIFFCRLEPFKASFARTFIDRKRREKREQDRQQLTASGRDFVQSSVYICSIRAIDTHIDTQT